MQSANTEKNRFEWKALLVDEGVAITAEMEARLERHCALIRAWNEMAGVVSPHDLGHLWDRHVVDSLSLAALITQYTSAGRPLLDIGSGGGFPAIPVKVVLPELPLVLVERSMKKVGFLRKVVGELRLQDVSVIHGSFPEVVEGLNPGVITARAVEKPDKLQTLVKAFVESGAVYLCQAREPQYLAEVFYVELMEDAWVDAGLRRGSLRLVRSRV